MDQQKLLKRVIFAAALVSVVMLGMVLSEPFLKSYFMQQDIPVAQIENVLSSVETAVDISISLGILILLFLAIWIILIWQTISD